MARLRGCVISTSQRCAAVGIPFSAGDRYPTCLVICCFGSWLYRLQADRLGDLDDVSRRLLDGSGSPEKAGQNAANLVPRIADVRPGTSLSREWNGHMQRVTVLVEGFAWNGKTYPSLSQVAFAITGTRWNGPRFFGLRDKPSKRSVA
jgi:hypothetical protein